MRRIFTGTHMARPRHDNALIVSNRRTNNLIAIQKPKSISEVHLQCLRQWPKAYFVQTIPMRKRAEQPSLLSSEFNSCDSPANCSSGTTGKIEFETQQQRGRIAVLTSALPLKRDSGQDGDNLVLSKQIEKGDTTWYILSDSESNAYLSRCVTHLLAETATTKEGSLNNARCTDDLCRCKIQR